MFETILNIVGWVQAINTTRQLGEYATGGRAPWSRRKNNGGRPKSQRRRGNRRDWRGDKGDMRNFIPR